MKEIYAIQIYRCSGCGLCQKLCPWDAIRDFAGVLQIDLELCKGCGLCKLVCPLDSIVFSVDLEVPN